MRERERERERNPRKIRKSSRESFEARSEVMKISEEKKRERKSREKTTSADGTI